MNFVYLHRSLYRLYEFLLTKLPIHARVRPNHVLCQQQPKNKLKKRKLELKINNLLYSCYLKFIKQKLMDKSGYING